MKLVNRSYRTGEGGHVKLIPEDVEDVWHAFNLIRVGDRVTASTFRKVQRDTGVAAESDRVKITLTIEVEVVDFDPEGGSLRLKGRNMVESEHVKLGAYHTLELEVQRAFKVEKEQWDSLDVQLIAAACNPAASADLAALLITEGLATLLLVGTACTVVKAKIESTFPRKRGAAAAGFEKAVDKFFSKVLDAVLRHVDWQVVKCFVIAGPGFVKDDFKVYLEAEAVRRDLRPLLLNKSKVVLAPASSAFKHALKEVLALPSVASQIKDTKAAQESQALTSFYAMMSSDPSRAYYGPGHVKAAHTVGAIQTLLISDKLFRVADVARRQAYVTLVDEVRGSGGTAHVFSSMHVSGQQLNQLTGIAAILRFPMPELEDMDVDTDIL